MISIKLYKIIMCYIANWLYDIDAIVHGYFNILGMKMKI